LPKRRPDRTAVATAPRTRADVGAPTRARDEDTLRSAAVPQPVLRGVGESLAVTPVGVVLRETNREQRAPAAPSYDGSGQRSREAVAQTRRAALRTLPVKANDLHTACDQRGGVGAAGRRDPDGREYEGAQLDDSKGEDVQGYVGDAQLGADSSLSHPETTAFGGTEAPSTDVAVQGDRPLGTDAHRESTPVARLLDQQHVPSYGTTPSRRQETAHGSVQSASQDVEGPSFKGAVPKQMARRGAENAPKQHLYGPSLVKDGQGARVEVARQVHLRRRDELPMPSSKAQYSEAPPYREPRRTGRRAPSEQRGHAAPSTSLTTHEELPYPTMDA
jgi:hypothetical protein